jgi:hypothetical protein
MNWKCLLGHRWEVLSINPTRVFETNDSKWPHKIFTNILLQCPRCNAFKVKRIEGVWAIGSDDDVGDDDKLNELNHPPIPDDVFDALEAK